MHWGKRGIFSPRGAGCWPVYSLPLLFKLKTIKPDRLWSWAVSTFYRAGGGGEKNVPFYLPDPVPILVDLLNVTQKPTEVSQELPGHAPLSAVPLSCYSFLGLTFSICEMSTLGCILLKVPSCSDSLFLGTDGSSRGLFSGSPLSKLGRLGSLEDIVTVFEHFPAARNPGKLFSLPRPLSSEWSHSCLVYVTRAQL